MRMCVCGCVCVCVLTVPANDSVFDNLLEMRQRLGWVTKIPRHGPDCKKDMAKLSDKPLTEKVGLLDGLEISAGCVIVLTKRERLTDRLTD